MMGRWLFIASVSLVCRAAVIRGTVVEHQTGRPLARAVVMAQAVAGTPGGTASVRTDMYGAFAFPQLAGGVYLVSASRRGFAPAEYGQKSPQGSGLPIILDEGTSAAISIRLQRYGSVAGTLLDENDVGLPELDVAAFRNTRPPQMAARATTDDRGAYRIWGLEPGSYLVRSLAKHFDDAGYLPAFFPQASRVDDARPVEVALDQQVNDVNVRPIPGQLLKVAGRAYGSFLGQVNLTLISDMGPEFAVSDSSGNFEFNPVAPGAYELSAQASTDRRGGNSGVIASWMPLVVDRDTTDVRLYLSQAATVSFAVENTKGEPVDPRTLRIQYRKKDLSGEGKPQNLTIQAGRAQIMPGRWEIGIAPMATYYVASFTGPRPDAAVGRADGWNELTVAGQQMAVKIVLAADPGTIRGKVTTSGQELAAGAPVFLEAYDLDRRQRLVELRTTRADIHGQYQFVGLAPGAYRLLATYEYRAPDSSAMESASTKVVRVEAGRDHALDLDLWVIR